jgi:proline iminopeptidase
MRAKIRDTEIYFDVEGAGVVPDGPRMREKPVMIALHGGPGLDHTSHKPVLSSLADKVQIVYVDHRGQGRSARGAKESYTLENNVEDLESLRLYLGLDKVILLGTSYGGMVALTYASRYPQNVSHLIAVVTASDHRFLDRAKQILKERGTPEQNRVCERLWQGNFENEDQLRDFFEVMGPIYSRKFDLKVARERRQRAIVSIDALNQGFATFLRTYDVTDDLAKITATTLVIAGRYDWICPPEFSEIIASKIKKADLRIFDDSSHAVSVDEPQNYVDAIRGFLTYKP